MRNSLFIVVLGCISLLLACKGTTDSTAKSTSNPASAATTSTTGAHPLPSISEAEMKKLYENCDYIDFIFYHMDFSMSVNAITNVRRVVTFVDKAQPAANLTCPAIGRIIYLDDGELLIEADMHFGKDCQHLVFYKDNKQVYANRITPQGIAYFQQMFNQVKVVPKE